MSLKEFQEKLFKDAGSLPSTACRRRYLDAMLCARDMKANHSDLAQRVAPEDKPRLVRERFMALKSCVVLGKDEGKMPYLYHLNAAGAEAAHHH